MRTNRGHGQVADDDETCACRIDIERSFAKNGGCIDGLPFEEVIGPGIGNAFARSLQLTGRFMSQRAQEVFDGPGSSLTIDHDWRFTKGNAVEQTQR